VVRTRYVSSAISPKSCCCSCWRGCMLFHTSTASCSSWACMSRRREVHGRAGGGGVDDGLVSSATASSSAAASSKFLRFDLFTFWRSTAERRSPSASSGGGAERKRRLTGSSCRRSGPTAAVFLFSFASFLAVRSDSAMATAEVLWFPPEPHERETTPFWRGCGGRGSPSPSPSSSASSVGSDVVFSALPACERGSPFQAGKEEAEREAVDAGWTGAAL